MHILNLQTLVYESGFGTLKYIKLDIGRLLEKYVWNIIYVEVREADMHYRYWDLIYVTLVYSKLNIHINKTDLVKTQSVLNSSNFVKFLETGIVI